jgi:hypothetical protein
VTASPKFKGDLRTLDAEVVLSCSTLIAIVEGKVFKLYNSATSTSKHPGIRSPCNGRGTPVMLSHLSQAHVQYSTPEYDPSVSTVDSILSRLLSSSPLMSPDTGSTTPQLVTCHRTSRTSRNVSSIHCPVFSAWVWLYDIDHHWVKSMYQIHPTQMGPHFRLKFLNPTVTFPPNASGHRHWIRYSDSLCQFMGSA